MINTEVDQLSGKNADLATLRAVSIYKWDSPTVPKGGDALVCTCCQTCQQTTENNNTQRGGVTSLSAQDDFTPYLGTINWLIL